MVDVYAHSHVYYYHMRISVHIIMRSLTLIILHIIMLISMPMVMPLLMNIIMPSSMHMIIQMVVPIILLFMRVTCFFWAYPRPSNFEYVQRIQNEQHPFLQVNAI